MTGISEPRAQETSNDTASSAIPLATFAASFCVIGATRTASTLPLPSVSSTYSILPVTSTTGSFPVAHLITSGLRRDAASRVMTGITSAPCLIRSLASSGAL